MLARTLAAVVPPVVQQLRLSLARMNRLRSKRWLRELLGMQTRLMAMGLRSGGRGGAHLARVS